MNSREYVGREGPSPLGEKVPEGRMRGPSGEELPPHQFGRMTYGRAIKRSLVDREPNATISHGLTSSPQGERRALRTYWRARHAEPAGAADGAGRGGRAGAGDVQRQPGARHRGGADLRGRAHGYDRRRSAGAGEVLSQARPARTHRAARAARPHRARGHAPLRAAQPKELRHRHGAVPAGLVHHEAQPAPQRAHGASCRASAISIRCSRSPPCPAPWR